MLALIFPQLWQTVSNSFLTLAKKPRRRVSNNTNDFAVEVVEYPAYRCERRELRARYGRNVRDILFGLPHKSRSSTGDRSFPSADHSNLLPAVVAFGHPVNLVSMSPVHLPCIRGADHRLWVFHMSHAHPLDLLRGEETKLDLLDCAQRRLRVRKEDVRHGDGCRSAKRYSVETRRWLRR